MTAEQYINQTLPYLKPSDTVGKAITWMEEFQLQHLPVIENNHYEGLLERDNLFHFNEDSEDSIENLRLFHQASTVQLSTHLYEVVRLAISNELSLLPILDEENHFVGSLTTESVLHGLAETFSMQAPGSVLVLSLYERDYSVAEISRIIEGENAKILSLMVGVSEQDPAKIEVTLKINKKTITTIVSAFERFGYQIVAQFGTTEPFNLDKDRLSMLMRYINV